MGNLLILLVLFIGYPIKSLVYSELTSSRRGCVLPKNSVNIRFCSFECDDCSSGKWIYEPGDTVKHLVKVQCEPGHRMEGDKVNQMALCLKGQWIPPIPICNKVCPSLKSYAVTFKCSFGHVPVDCSTSSVLPGTTASYKCKPDYVTEQNIDLVCSPGGLWLGTFPKCVLGKDKFENKLNSLNSVCGRSPKKTRMKRVVLSENAELGEYPWIAAVGLHESNGEISWDCGGILISDQYVVSTASCIGPIGTSHTYTVRIGDLDLDDSVQDGASPLDFMIESTVIHEQYNSSLNINDIGLIKLERKVEFNDFIQPICLPPPEFRDKSFEDHPVELAAWGTADYDTGVKLRRKNVNIISLEACRLNYTLVTGSKVDNNTICTWHLEKDTCQVPAGAPLMISQDSRMFLLGITSFGVLCSRGKYPEINVRVPQYTSWILNHMDL